MDALLVADAVAVFAGWLLVVRRGAFFLIGAVEGAVADDLFNMRLFNGFLDGANLAVEDMICNVCKGSDKLYLRLSNMTMFDLFWTACLCRFSLF